MSHSLTQVNMADGGDESERGNQSMEVHLCKAKNQDSTYREKASESLQNAFGYLLQMGKIDYWRVTEYNTEFTVSTYGNPFNEWEDWYQTNTGQHFGAWLAVHGSSNSGANAAYAYGNAWNSDVPATVSTTRNSNDAQFRNLAVHEVFHTYLAADGCDEVNKLKGGGHGDHSLGMDQTYTDHHERTPMSTGHGEASADGECSNRVYGVQYTHVPTHCTMDSLVYTYEHKNGISH